MTVSIGNAFTRVSLAAAAVLLAGCFPGDQGGAREGRYVIDVTQDTQATMVDGPMTSVNGCIERNDTAHFDEAAARTACIWAHSVPFNGMPPGVTGHLAYAWPQAMVTIRNNNAIIMLTQVCVRLQLNLQSVVQSACGNAAVSPMSSGTLTIDLRNELDALGIAAEFIPQANAFRWEVLSVRYIQLLEPANEG